MDLETYKIVNKLAPVCLHDLVNVKNSKYAFRYSNINFCPLAWHFCTDKNSKKLEKVQERALRFVYDEYTSSYINLLEIRMTIRQSIVIWINFRPMVCPLILYPFLSPTNQIGNNKLKLIVSWAVGLTSKKVYPKGQSWSLYFLMSLLMIFFILWKRTAATYWFLSRAVL
jgi:hypothetical protein